MAGRFTRLVAIQTPLPNSAVWPTEAAAGCRCDPWMSAILQASGRWLPNLRANRLTSSSTMPGSGPRGQTIGNIDYEVWARVLDVNTLGPIRVAEAFVDNVAQSERKLIVTITSGMGSIGDNTSGGAFAYRSSKAAVNMVMRSLAIDLAPRGITCVVINPRWVRTDMGGPHATLTTAQSVKRLRRLIDTLGPAQSGRFSSITTVANTPGRSRLIVGAIKSDTLIKHQS